MDKIKELQYNNLRKCLNENLIKPILGEDYYNMTMDVYTADKETTMDLKRKFDYKDYEVKVFKIISVFLFVAVVILTIIKL